MTIGTLVEKLRSKKHAAARSAFGHYLETVRKLASGSEIDSDEVGHILDAAGKDEDDLTRDVSIQQQRLAWAARLQANQQAVVDRVQAERDLQAAQQKLQAEIDRHQPAVDLARGKLADANYRHQTTMNADSMLCEHVLDAELLQREQAIAAQLRDIVAELKPLTADRQHKLHSLENAEFTLSKLQARKEGDWIPAGIVQFFNQPRDIRELSERVADLQSQLHQLASLIAPRQREQVRLQGELDAIQSEKLKP